MWVVRREAPDFIRKGASMGGTIFFFRPRNKSEISKFQSLRSLRFTDTSYREEVDSYESSMLDTCSGVLYHSVE